MHLARSGQTARVFRVVLESVDGEREFVKQRLPGGHGDIEKTAIAIGAGGIAAVA